MHLRAWPCRHTHSLIVASEARHVPQLCSLFPCTAPEAGQAAARAAPDGAAGGRLAALLPGWSVQVQVQAAGTDAAGPCCCWAPQASSPAQQQSVQEAACTHKLSVILRPFSSRSGFGNLSCADCRPGRPASAFVQRTISVYLRTAQACSQCHAWKTHLGLPCAVAGLLP